MMDLFAPTHLMIVLAIVLVLFGPSKLGDIGGALGKAIHDFKRAMNEQGAPTSAKAIAAEVKTVESPMGSG